MCMEDVRIGRRAAFTEADVAVGVVSVQLIVAAPNRYSLVLGAPLVGTFTFSTNTPAVSGVGLQLTAGQPPINLNVRDHGQMVTQGWYAICSGAGQTCFVGSTLLSDQ
jgi:hypothetical protein